MQGHQGSIRLLKEVTNGSPKLKPGVSAFVSGSG